MSRLKQPLLGIIGTVLIMVMSFAFISLFAWPTFAGWVSYAMMCAIPATILIGAVWKSEVPAGIARQGQPLSGALYLALTAALASVVGLVHYLTVGGGVSPPTPVLIQTIIVSVVVAFWLSVMWAGWPFVLIRNRVTAGLSLLIGIYAVNAVLFRVFFSYDFLRGAPFYRADLDPHGAFNGWDATVFAVTCLSVMFLLAHLDLWPLSRFPRLMRQPVLGLVWTVIALVIGGGLFMLATSGLGIDAPVFLVRVPIPFIFGSVVLLNMLQGSVFARFTQPLKGLLGAITAIIVGNLLAFGYTLLMPTLTGHLASGAPSNDAEVWLANALLAVTFPFLAFHVDFFQRWPLGARAPRGAQPQAPAAIRPVDEAGAGTRLG